MPTQFLYFDVGNVLLSFCHDQMCRQMAEVAGVDADMVKQILFHDDETLRLLDGIERGEVGEEQFYQAFCQRTDSRPELTALAFAASDIFTPLEEVHELVMELASAGHRLGLLSNSNVMHWRFFTDGRYPVLKSPGQGSSPFEVSIASQEVFAAKPDPEIYRIAIDRASTPGDAIFFVDDRPENVSSARAAGIDAVLFTTPNELKENLRQRNVIAS